MNALLYKAVRLLSTLVMARGMSSDGGGKKAGLGGAASEVGFLVERMLALACRLRGSVDGMEESGHNFRSRRCLHPLISRE